MVTPYIYAGDIMSEDVPLSLRKKLIEMQKRMLLRRSVEKKVEAGRSPLEIVTSVLENEKAREVLEYAKMQYPEATEYALLVLAKLIESGRIKSLDGYLLYNLLHALGIPVRLPSKIKFVKKGREVDISEYLKD